MSELSERAEEYVEAIHDLRKKLGRNPRLFELASHLGVSQPSALEMVRKLEKIGLVRYEHERGIALTEEGENEVLDIKRRHRILEEFLTRLLSFPPEFAHEVACKLEHSIPKEVVSEICKLLGHPRICPGGSEIPAGECCLRETTLRRLDEMEIGEEGVVEHILGIPKNVSKVLEDIGMRVGSRVRVEGRSGEMIHVRIENGEITSIDRLSASRIFVRTR